MTRNKRAGGKKKGQAGSCEEHLHVGQSTGVCFTFKWWNCKNKVCCQDERAVCGKMAQIQDANWLIAPLSLAAMLMGAACQFCNGSFDLQESFPRRGAVQQLFVTTSLEQLLLYVLNLVVMAALLPQDQLKLVPILVIMFIFGRWGSKARKVESSCEPMGLVRPYRMHDLFFLSSPSVVTLFPILAIWITHCGWAC